MDVLCHIASQSSHTEAGSANGHAMLPPLLWAHQWLTSCVTNRTSKGNPEGIRKLVQVGSCHEVSGHLEDYLHNETLPIRRL